MIDEGVHLSVRWGVIVIIPMVELRERLVSVDIKEFEHVRKVLFG